MASSTTCALLVLLAALVHTGSSLMCWRCSSAMSGYCGEPFNTTGLKQQDCAELQGHILPSFDGKMLCKRTILPGLDVGGEKRVVRTCVYQLPGIDSCSQETKAVQCDVCDTDGCNNYGVVDNDASPLRLSLAAVAAFLLARLLC